VRELSLPRRHERRGARPLRLDGVRRELHRDVGPHRAAVRGLLAGTRDLPVRPVHGHHHDGRLHELAVGDPGVPHRGAVPDGELLPVDRHGPHPRGGAVPAVHQVAARHSRPGRDRVGHAAHHDRRLEGAGGDGRLAPPSARRARRHERQAHRREPDDPHDVPVGSPVPPRQPAPGWGTPHTMLAASKQLAAMGGSHHPLLGALGVMSAKNTAVNLMILTTFLSFLLYRRANTPPVVPWARTGTMIQGAMFAIAAGIVLFYGIRGYFVEAIVRIGFSVYQVLAVLACILSVTVIDILMARGAQSLGGTPWGTMPPRST